MSPLPQDRTLAQQLSGAFILFGSLVAAGFLVTALAYGVSWAWLTPETERVRLSLRAEGAANAAMLDEETGLRAYLWTRDRRFLDLYARAEVALAQANEALSAGSVRELAAPMLGTRLAEERWKDQWAKIAADIRSDGVGPSIGEGEVLFDAYRIAQLRFADALNERSDTLNRRDQRVILFRVALDLAVFLIVLVLAARQHRALRDSIVVPVAALLHHIAGVRDGRLEATVDPSGPYELRRLGEGLNEMGRALAAARESAESRDENLRGHSVQLRQILDASRGFSESLNLRYVVGAVRESTTALGGYERVTVWLMDDAQKRLVDAEEGTSSVPENESPRFGNGFAERAVKSGRTTFEGAAGQVRFDVSSLGPIRAIAIPLIVGARVVGALEARHPEARTATMQAIELLETLGTHAATAIESARLHELTEERSHVDALTRLFNRRRLEEDLETECKRCLRYGRPLAFVMLDVDHFKTFNDSHGHPQADTALQEVADVIAGCARSTDTAYRYGGEEFCIILRETGAEDAMIFSERVRQRIEQRFASGGTAGITASFGVAEFSAAAPMPRALVEAADAAMYESKHAGRNRVSLSSIPPFAPGMPNAELEPHLS